jgi:serine/threonine protein phosphatase 1
MPLPFLRRAAAVSPRLPPEGPPGRRCYAIGDVHGRLDLLEQLLRDIEQHIKDRPSGDHTIVFLGDLIDRGPQSRQVLSLLRADPLPGARLVCLKGNHEEALVRGLSGVPSRLTDWLGFGGDACAQSYGVSIGDLFGRSAEHVEQVLLNAIPERDIQFMDSFLDSARFGDYFFAHAGVRPGVALDRQSPKDLYWIRDEFLTSDADHGAIVVHGHSISASVDERPNRICIDTGAYKSGVLTALWIEGAERGILQTPAVDQA